MKNIVKYSVVLAVLGLSSCYYDNKEELYPFEGQNCETANLTYTTNIKVLVDKSCAVSGCHVSGAQTPVLETYTQVKAIIDNGKFEQRVLVQKDMPTSGPLSDCEQSQLTQWIADGAPEN